MGSEMCIRDSLVTAASVVVLADDLLLLAAAWIATSTLTVAMLRTCLLYTSDAADDLPCVDLGGRRLITKQT
mgnify:CR=1 FL=1